MSKTILILHGWNSSKKNWAQVEKLLVNEGHQVFIPDLPGFGENPPPEKPWTNDDYLNWVLNFINTNPLAAKPLILVGHSFGGGLAMKLAIDHPELIERLVLIGAARVRHKPTLRKKILKVVAKLGKSFAKIPLLRKAFYKFIVRESDYVRTSGVMRDTFRNVVKVDLTSGIPKIKTPTLIIWGDKDTATPIEDAYLLNKSIEDSKLAVIKNSGHALNLEVPNKLVQLIHDFIS